MAKEDQHPQEFQEDHNKEEEAEAEETEVYQDYFSLDQAIRDNKATKNLNRKTMSFFKKVSNFREPYNVICDGSFLSYIALRNISTEIAIQMISFALKTKLCYANVYVTSCVIKELESKSKLNLLEIAKNFTEARCYHPLGCSSQNCIKRMIGKTNPSHFIVGTENKKLIRHLKQLPGVPIMFGAPEQNKFFLEPPSTSQKEGAEEKEEERKRKRD